jgi:hypothetical protein
MFELRKSGENRRKLSEIFFENLPGAYKDLIKVKKKIKNISCLCTFKRMYKLYISLPSILKMPPSRLGGIGRGELWGKCQQTKHKSPGKHLCSYISQGIRSPHKNIFCTVHVTTELIMYHTLEICNAACTVPTKGALIAHQLNICIILE